MLPGFFEALLGPYCAANEIVQSAVRYQMACQKAEALLMEWLTPQQREQYRTELSFTVVGSATGTVYRIHGDAGAYNVQVENTPIKLCFGPAAVLPRCDILLAQKVMLETNEPRVLVIANRT